MDILHPPEVAHALRRAEDRLKVALVAGRMATWEWDPQSDQVTASDTLRSLFGLLPADRLETSAQRFSLVHAADREAHEARVQAALRAGGAWQLEYRIVRPCDGRVVWLEERAHTVRNAGTGRDTLLGVAWDITERKELEEALRENESRYRTLFDAIDQGLCIQQMVLDEAGCAVDACCLEVNQAFERMTGWSGVAGRSTRELWGHLDTSWLPLQGQVAVDGEPLRFQSHVAAWDRWFDVYCVRIGAPHERKVASVVTDITERRRSEERLRRVAEYDAFRAALNEALRELDDAADIQAAATALLAAQLALDRACHEDFAQAQAERPTGAVLAELLAGRGIVVCNLEADRRFTLDERQPWIARGVHAFVLVPIAKGGRLLGYLSAQQCNPREWTADDIAKVEETAQVMWTTLERASSEAALRRVHEELEARVEERTGELARSNDLLRRQVAQRQRAEQARNELLRQLLNAQEEERRRISRELHDELGQQVSALVLKLAMMRQEATLPPRLREQIEGLEKIAHKTDSDLDFLVWQLRPTVLDDLGLIAALRDYAANWSSHFGVECTFAAVGGEGMRLGSEIETVLYRFAQETLNNIAKHARATRVVVRLERGATRASLCVEDDGVGFNTDRGIPLATGLGLVGMRERASFVGGELTIRSRPGSGTHVKVDVPLPTAA